MEAEIFEMAATAGRMLVNPFAIAASVATLLTLVTGVAGRVVVFFEDLRYSTPPTIQAPATGARQSIHR